MSGSGISWAICKSAPCSRQITTPAPHHSFFTGRMPFLPPNQQHQSTEGKFFFWKNKHFHYYHKLVTRSRRIIYTKSYIRIRQIFSNKSNFKIFGSNLLLGTGISAIDYKIKIKNTHKIIAFQLVLSTRALHLWRSNIMDKILTLVQCQQLSWIYYSATWAEMQCWQSARPVCVDFFLFLTMIFLRSRSGLGSAMFTSSWAQHAINNNNNE